MVDIDSLRNDLEETFGPAALIDPAAAAALIAVQSASPNDLVDMALSMGVDPNDYEVPTRGGR